MYDNLKRTLAKYGQEHLLRFWDELDSAEKEQLANQINEIDFAYVSELINSHVLEKPEIEIPENIEPAPYFPLYPENAEEKRKYEDAVVKGVELISSGKTAALTVAGGQGTRLGFDGPKGTYPITPLKKKALFQYFAESILKINEKYNTCLKWFIMTSGMNDKATRDYFEKNEYFNLVPESVFFFAQGTMPAVDYKGKILLEAKSSLALSPDGHGGTLLALRKSQALKEMRESGIEYISYFQVDNPLVSIIDPLFVGLHCLEKAEASARMLPKTGPYEKLGNFCVVNGRLQIIEYSDMPPSLAEARDSAGKLKFISGSPAIHVFSRDFIEKLTEGGTLELPWHRADKKVSYVDVNGDFVKPSEPNAVKLESFIFDALPLAKKTVVLEARRDEEFAPTKNPTGVDSVESCREMLIARDAARLKEAGADIPLDENGKPDCILEISPEIIIDKDDARAYVRGNNISVKPGDEVYIGK